MGKRWIQYENIAGSRHGRNPDRGRGFESAVAAARTEMQCDVVSIIRRKPPIGIVDVQHEKQAFVVMGNLQATTRRCEEQLITVENKTGK